MIKELVMHLCTVLFLFMPARHNIALHQIKLPTTVLWLFSWT